MADDKPKAILFMLFSAACFAVMGAFVKLSGDLPVYEKVVMRNLVSMLIALILVLKNGRRLFGARSSQPWLLGRSIFGILGVMGYFYAIDRLLLADAVMLNKLSPFFVTLFAVVLLDERMTKSKITALIAAFVGALLVIKPRFDLSVLPAVIGLTSAMFAGLAYTVVRFLRSKEHPETIVFYFSFASVAALSPIALIDFVRPTLLQFAWMIGIGVMAAGGQFGLTLAYRFAPASEVAVFNYATILMSAILGFLIFTEVPDIFSVFGGVLIIAAGLQSYRNARRAAAPKTVVK